MSNDTNLWVGSPAWRWLLGITLLTTAIVLLVGPWNKPSKLLPSLATYTAPAQQAAQKNQVLTRSGALPAPQVQGPVAVGNATAGPRDATFDVPVALPSVSFPSGTELHLIGVYEGAPPPGQSEQAWWTKCLPFKDNQQAMAECHQKYAGQRSPKLITVTVSRVGVPMVLVLMAYDAVTWKIVMVPGVTIKKIILAGYAGSDITGVPDNIPVDVHSYESSLCQICSRQPDHFYAYKKDTAEYTKANNKLRDLTGLAASSFQGAYQSDRFSIGSHTAPPPNLALIASTQRANDPYTEQFFVNQIKLLDSVVPLPEGRWRGLAYARNPSNRGRDEMVVMGLIDNSQLAELLAIRAQSVGDNRGFARQLSCERNDVHATQTIANESFGQQFCYWVNHASQPWIQPILSLAVSRLTSLGVAAPDTLINVAFHKADASTSITAYYFKNPEVKGITSVSTTWATSPWHPQNIKQFPEKSAFVQDRIQWANSWLPIFKASR